MIYRYGSWGAALRVWGLWHSSRWRSDLTTILMGEIHQQIYGFCWVVDGCCVFVAEHTIKKHINLRQNLLVWHHVPTVFWEGGVQPSFRRTHYTGWFRATSKKQPCYTRCWLGEVFNLVAINQLYWKESCEYYVNQKLTIAVVSAELLGLDTPNDPKLTGDSWKLHIYCMEFNGIPEANINLSCTLMYQDGPHWQTIDSIDRCWRWPPLNFDILLDCQWFWKKNRISINMCAYFVLLWTPNIS